MARYLITAAIVLAGLAALFLVPVRVPHNLKVSGRLLPVREWILMRDADGNLEGRLHDHARGTVNLYAVNRFLRGEAVRFELHPALQFPAPVAEGDTLGSVYSSGAQQLMVELTGSLAAVRAQIDLEQAGEKDALVREAEAQVAAAAERVRQQENQVRRLRTLHERSLVAAQLYEEAGSLLRVLQADQATAVARLAALQTGERAEQLDLTRTQASALAAEIDALRRRLDLFTITSPIAGRTAASYGIDTLLTVRDTSAYVVVMPVRWKEHRSLSTDLPVAVRVDGYPEAFPARIARLGDEIRLVFGEQVLLVTALIEQPDGIPPGALARCTISFGDRSVPAYLKQLAYSVFE